MTYKIQKWSIFDFISEFFNNYIVSIAKMLIIKILKIYANICKDLIFYFQLTMPVKNIIVTIVNIKTMIFTCLL